MGGKVSDAVKLLIIIAIVLFVLGTVFRLSRYDHYNPVPVINITPAAFHRAADTFVLFSIALGVWGLLAHKEGSGNPPQ